MTANPNRRSARIYPFPVRPRAGPGIPVDMRMPAGGKHGHAIPVSDFCSGWYHEAAIEKAASASRDS